jgi:predicted small lipoprotein YifL
MPPRSRSLPILAALGLVALAATACGRRGSLEPPPDGAAAPRQTSSRPLPAAPSSPIQDGDELSPSAVVESGTGAPLTTTKGAKRGYVIPKDPFLLDPLL